MLPNKDGFNPNNRRYSLFNPSKGQKSYPNSLANLIGNVINNDKNQQVSSSASRKDLQRSNTYDMSKSVCQRCKRFEVDLTNTSDNLNAIDTELKASRQVISLLQRQLELFQVEKDGLEKLIISQSSGTTTQASSGDIIDTGYDNDDQGDDSKISSDVMQKKLLKLIQTQLYAKDEEIVKLKTKLKETQNEKEQLNMQVHALEDDLSKLKVDNSLLRENLALRDQTIVSLSNEVFEQNNIEEYQQTPRRQSNIELLSNHRDSSHKTQRHIAKLVDTLEAYKKTNELLNTNVMKLTDRCTEAEKKEIETRSECQELEAKCCQIQSKLLSLLKEIEQSSSQSAGEQNQEFICSESVKLLIKRLLEDKSLDIPLSWKEGNKTKRHSDSTSRNSAQECDELGFYIPPDSLGENDAHSGGDSSSPSHHSNSRRSGLSKTGYVSHLAPVREATESGDSSTSDGHDNQSVNTRRQSVDSAKQDESSWRYQWDEFIKDFDKIDLDKSPEFKKLLRSGVPQEYRCKVWKALVDLKIGDFRKSRGSDYYQGLLTPNRPSGGSNASLNPSSKQIELDLLRTLPNNRYFESIDSPGTIRLRKVLTAYSAHNPRVGYCQGMNRLAAVALLVLPEEEAFWCLAAIVDKIMPVGYYNDLWLAQVDSNVVMEFVALKMPNLSEHFKREAIELSLFAWFLTIFVDGTPPALFLRLWDCFLYEGDKIMFRVALALLKMYENQLLSLNNSVAINNFLRSAVNTPMNIDQFFEVAFEWINPLPGKALRYKRQQNFKTMRAGLRVISDERTSHRVVKQDHSQDDENEDTPNEDSSSIISI